MHTWAPSWTRVLRECVLVVFILVLLYRNREGATAVHRYTPAITTTAASTAVAASTGTHRTKWKAKQVYSFHNCTGSSVWLSSRSSPAGMGHRMVDLLNAMHLAFHKGWCFCYYEKYFGASGYTDKRFVYDILFKDMMPICDEKDHWEKIKWNDLMQMPDQDLEHRFINTMALSQPYPIHRMLPILRNHQLCDGGYEAKNLVGVRDTDRVNFVVHARVGDWKLLEGMMLDDVRYWRNVLSFVLSRIPPARLNLLIMHNSNRSEVAGQEPWLAAAPESMPARFEFFWDLCKEFGLDGCYTGTPPLQQSIVLLACTDMMVAGPSSFSIMLSLLNRDAVRLVAIPKEHMKAFMPFEALVPFDYTTMYGLQREMPDNVFLDRQGHVFGEQHMLAISAEPAPQRS